MSWSGSSSTPWCCAPICPADPSFTGLLERVREAALGALDHQDVPFERLVEILAPARSLARHPLFQVMLTVQNNAPAVAGPARPASGRAARRARAAAQVRPGRHRGRGFRGDGGPAGLRGSVIVAADLFDPATAEMIAQRLVRVLEAVAADPQAPVRQVEVLDAAERRQVLARVE